MDLPFLTYHQQIEYMCIHVCVCVCVCVCVYLYVIRLCMHSIEGVRGTSEDVSMIFFVHLNVNCRNYCQ